MKIDDDLLLIVLTISLLLILGLIPALIAKSKGNNPIEWYFYGVFLFPIAVAHAIFSKKRKRPSGWYRDR